MIIQKSKEEIENKSNLIDSSLIKNKIEIGKGGFGVVYQGIWNEKKVAIKQIHSWKEDAKQIIEHELKQIKKLHHLNVVQCYGATNELIPSLVMEFIDGGKIHLF